MWPLSSKNVQLSFPPVITIVLDIKVPQTLTLVSRAGDRAWFSQGQYPTSVFPLLRPYFLRACYA